MTDATISDESEFPGEGMSSVPPPPVEPISVTDKFIGILTEPSVVFENVRAAGARASDWLVPVIVTAVILLVGMFLRFSNPAFMAAITEQQEKAMMKQVESGNMTQEQADQAMEQMDKMQGMIKVTGTLGAAVGFVIVFFILALLYWLVVRFAMKGDITYGLMLSVVGLATYISAIDQLLSLLLTFVTGQPFANLSPALFMQGDMQSMSTRLLMLLNPITIWSYYVLGIGFEKVANISRVKAMIAAFAIAVLFNALGALAGFGM